MHILIIPKEHIINVKDIDESNEQILVDIHRVANKLAKQLEIDEKAID